LTNTKRFDALLAVGKGAIVDDGYDARLCLCGIDGR
jgi:hypothetical protein